MSGWESKWTATKVKIKKTAYTIFIYHCAVGAAYLCYWDELMLLECELMLLKCELLLLKCELLLLKCELMLLKSKNTKKSENTVLGNW